MLQDPRFWGCLGGSILGQGSHNFFWALRDPYKAGKHIQTPSTTPPSKFLFIPPIFIVEHHCEGVNREWEQQFSQELTLVSTIYQYQHSNWRDCTKKYILHFDQVLSRVISTHLSSFVKSGSYFPWSQHLDLLISSDLWSHVLQLHFPFITLNLKPAFFTINIHTLQQML